MKCEECLPLIEEYVDGELNERDTARVDSHITTCTSCAQELETLSREQEIYASYERDVRVSQAQWNIVRARIEQEKDAHLIVRESAGLKGWLAGIFGSHTLFRPAFIAALVLIAVGVTAGVMYLSYRNQRSDVARVDKPKDIQTSNPIPEAPQITETREGKTAVVSNENKERKTAVERITTEKNNRKRELRNNQAPVLAKLPRPVYRRRALDVPVGAAFVEEVAVNRPSEASGDFDFDITRHAEKAQMLLRSFRNMQAEASHHVTDVSYEKEQSRRLLYQNIALRREAEGRRDPTARELLDTLEPILLDIANLPDKARGRDVRSIEQRMEKKEIVAALQVRQLLAAN